MGPCEHREPAEIPTAHGGDRVRRGAAVGVVANAAAGHAGEAAVGAAGAVAREGAPGAVEVDAAAAADAPAVC